MVFLGIAVLGFSQNPGTDREIQKLNAEAQAARDRGDLTGAIQKLEAILKLDPHVGGAYNNLGVLYFQEQDYPQAAATFEKGLRYEPSMFSSLLLMGISYFQMHEYRRAQETLEKATALQPRNEQSLLYLGQSLFYAGQQEAGISVLHKLVQQSPRNVEALYSLGEMHLKLARETMKKIASVAPESYLVQLIDGEVRESSGDYEGALTFYKKAAAQEPNFPAIRYKIVNIYLLQGKGEEAAAELEREVALRPHDCVANSMLGDLLVKAHTNSAQALLHIQGALEVCPDLAHAHTDYGVLLAEKGEDEKAVEQFKRAIQLNPDEEGVHYMLGKIFQKMGHLKEAKAEFALQQEMNAKARNSVEAALSGETK
jgi:tetratricopeptide (TPR) repeat protein